MKRLWPVILIMAFVLLAPLGVWADAQFPPDSEGTLYTTVKDGAGNPVNDATVTVTLWASNGTAMFSDESMPYLAGSYGKYYYTFTAPSVEGDYIAESYAVGYGYGSETVHIIAFNATNNYNYTTNNYTGNYTYTGSNASDIWGENTTDYDDPATFGGLVNLVNSIIGGIMELMQSSDLVNIILVIALLGFALWRKGWVRILLSLCIIIWGVFYLSNDIKIAAPLIAVGSVLFIQAILAQIQHAREETE